MEIVDIENMISLCSGDRAILSRKAQTLVLVNNIASVWNNKGLAGKKLPEDIDYSSVVGTLEDKFACLAKTFFGVANKLGMDMHSLKLNKMGNYESLEDVILSMESIALSNYRMEKKLIILIGKMFSYCLYMGIDVLWFLSKKLNYDRMLNNNL